jgi:Protein of unknown function (DUF2971)
MNQKEDGTENWKKLFIQKMFLQSEQDSDEAIELKHQNLPTSLFRYRGINQREIDSFKQGIVWHSEPSKFNDPYDCLLTMLLNSRKLIDELLANPKDGIYSKFCYEIQEKLSAEDKNDPTKIREVREACLEQILDKLRDMYHICCFSECNDSMLMWSHYANSHKGFCIEYTVPDKEKYLYPVLYTSRPYDENARKVFCQWEESLESQTSYRELQNYFAIIKYSDWSYENEWRLIYPRAEKRHNPPLKRISPTQTSLMTAKAIYLGCKVEKGCCYEYLLEVASNKKIDVYQMELSMEEFKVVPKLILSGQK